MNNIKTVFLYLLILACNPVKALAQTENQPRIEKRLYHLYQYDHNLWNKWKKCNKVAKRYIKRHDKDDVSYESACYYAALSYLDYEMWDFNKRNVSNDRAWIMYRKPLNYIDSAFRYNQLFMVAAGIKLLDTAHIWRQELFPDLFNSVWTEVIQRESNKYYKEEKEGLYEKYKSEFDQMFGWHATMIDVAHDYFPWLESPLYVSFLGMRHECGFPISSDELSKMRALIEEQLIKYKCGDNVPENEFFTGYCRSEFGMLFELDTALFFDYARLYERNGFPTPFSVGPYSDFYDNEKFWKFERNRIDLGTIYISDSTRYLTNAFDTTFSMNILTDIYPDDTLRFLSIEREQDFGLETLQFVDASPLFTSKLKENQLQLNFILKNKINIHQERQWLKIEERYFVKTNRGTDDFFLVYRLQYRN